MGAVKPLPQLRLVRKSCGKDRPGPLYWTGAMFLHGGKNRLRWSNNEGDALLLPLVELERLWEIRGKQFISSVGGSILHIEVLLSGGWCTVCLKNPVQGKRPWIRGEARRVAADWIE